MQSHSSYEALRIGLVAWDYPPARSGLAVAAREVAESLIARGHDVRVLSLDRHGDEGRIVGAGRYLTGDLRALRERAGTGHLAAPIAFARAAAAAHRAKPFDLVEATNWYAPAACMPRLGLPLVTRCSTPATGTAGRDDPRGVFDLACAAALERHQARAADALISNTAHHGVKVASLYGCPPPADEEGTHHAVIGLSLPPNVAGEAPPPPLQAPFRLLFIGRATRRKGFDALLSAARHLGGGFELRLVGIEASAIELPANCRPLGTLDDEGLREEFRSAHAVLAPSRYESFGLVYQEAIRAGRPVIACAEDPAARAFVGGAGTGLLAATADGAGLAAAARALVEVPARYEAARAACQVAALRFTREALGRRTEAVYRSVLARPVQGLNGVRSAASSLRRAVSVVPSAAIAP